MSVPLSLPWLHEAWEGIQARRSAGRLPHALLFTGMEGVGKQVFASHLAQSLLCTQPDAAGHACGQCKSCSLFAAGNHPDYRYLTLELNEGTGKLYRDIRIDQVRSLVEYLSLKSQYEGHRVAFIEPAERMNVNAANSLLKTLEEPGEGSVLILASSRPSRLPATIRSRCQQLVFHTPAKPQALAWLQQQGVAQAELALALAGGAPLRARELIESGALEQRQACLNELLALARGRAEVLTVAAGWSKQEDHGNLRWLASWLMDMIRIRAADTPAQLSNPDQLQDLQAMADRVDLVRLYRYLDRILEALRLETANLNRQLLFEDLLFDWRSLFARAV